MARRRDLADSDDALVARAKAGDGEALGALISRYRGSALELAYWMIQGEGEDAVQEANLVAARAIGRLRGPFRPWYLRVVHNQCCAVVRVRRIAVPLVDDDGREVPVAVEDTGFWVKEKLSAALGAMSALSDLERNALLMSEIDDLGFREIARILDAASEGAARDAAYRARRKIAERMKQEGW